LHAAQDKVYIAIFIAALFKDRDSIVGTVTLGDAAEIDLEGV